MIDVKELLKQSAAQVGPSGAEGCTAQWFADQFRPFVDEVEVDRLFSVRAHIRGNGPRIMVCAHLDEIAMLVKRIEDDGSLRLSCVGGIDPRTLPGSRVWIHTAAGRLFGTVGAVPPHLSTAGDRSKAYAMDDILVDIGFDKAEAGERVKVGDLVTYQEKAAELLNDQVAAKTMDDRACVVLMLCAAEYLKKLHADADIWFVCSSAEEVGGWGAGAAAFDIDPDMALILDADFGDIPGSAADTAIPMDRMNIALGPYLQPKLSKRLMDCADEHHIEYSVSVLPRTTGTDTDEIAVTRAGIPSMLLSLPLKYMHSSVETVSVKTIREGGRLVAHFLAELDEHWRDDLWN